MLDERWIRSLHVESMRHADLHREREAHVLFQASTIGALLEGAFEGDLSFAELAEHGDLGLGTLNHLDGEMVALDGEFFRADVDGRLHQVAGEERTPFAVVTRFEPEVDEALADEALSHEELLSRIDELIPAGASSCAIRLDGHFELLRARSVPRQEPPYRPLTEVVADQHVFELEEVEGTMVGFRFPAYAEGIEVAGTTSISPTPTAAAAATSSTRARAVCGPASTPPTTSTSSCRRGSSSPTPTSPPRPTPRSRLSSAASFPSSRAGFPGPGEEVVVLADRR